MVLNAGSREFIGIRDRKLQRLYLSPLIDLDDPHSLPAGYFKIHTGLQIAALHDVIQRAKRLQQLEALSQAPKLRTFKYDRAEPYQDKETNITKMPRLSKSTTTAKEAKTKVLEDSTHPVGSDSDNFSSLPELTSEVSTDNHICLWIFSDSISSGTTALPATARSRFLEDLMEYIHRSFGNSGQHNSDKIKCKSSKRRRNGGACYGSLSEKRSILLLLRRQW